MNQAVSSFRERFDRARKAYKDIAGAPKQREERRRAFNKIRCLFFIGLPLCLLTMAFGQWMGWSVYRVRSIALPVSIALSFGISNYLANKNKNLNVGST
jgi:hypothetical protein